MKCRLLLSDWQLAQVYAYAVGISTPDWIDICLRKFAADVALARNRDFPTIGDLNSDGRETIVSDVPDGYTPWVVRACILRGLEHCRAAEKAAPKFKTKLRAGIDYCAPGQSVAVALMRRAVRSGRKGKRVAA